MACGHSGQKLGAGATARRAARRDIPAAASSGLAVRQRPAWCRRPEPPRLPAVRRDIPAAARTVEGDSPADGAGVSSAAGAGSSPVVSSAGLVSSAGAGSSAGGVSAEGPGSSAVGAGSSAGGDGSADGAGSSAAGAGSSAGCGLLGRRRLSRWRRFLSGRCRLFRWRGLFGCAGLLFLCRSRLASGRGLFRGGSGFLVPCGLRLFLSARSGFRQRRRVVVLGAQEGDDVRPLLGIRNTGEGHHRPRRKFLRIMDEGVDQLVGPVARMGLHRRRVVEALDGGDLPPEHPVEVGADHVGAAFVEVVADLAERGVRLSSRGIGRGQQPEHFRFRRRFLGGFLAVLRLFAGGYLEARLFPVAFFEGYVDEGAGAEEKQQCEQHGHGDLIEAVSIHERCPPARQRLLEVALADRARDYRACAFVATRAIA